MNRLVTAASTGVIGAALIFGTAEAGRQKTEWYDCGPLVTNGNHWGWECEGPTVTPTVVVTATPTVAPTPSPTPVFTPAPTPTATPVATATPVIVEEEPTPEPTKTPTPKATPAVTATATPVAVLVATPVPVLVPASPIQEPVPFAPVFVPQPPKAGSGGFLDDAGVRNSAAAKTLLILVALGCAGAAGYITGRK